MRPVYGEPVPRSPTNRTRVRSINTEIALLYSDNMKARKRSVLSSRRSQLNPGHSALSRKFFSTKISTPHAGSNCAVQL
jgi:hypothetical protein